MKQKTEKIDTSLDYAHFTDNSFLNPTNPISVNVIGAGGTGSRLVTELAVMNNQLWALGHPGLQVTLFDDDIISEANTVNQRFAQSEIGLSKAVQKINAINRWFGTNWKAVPMQYSSANFEELPNYSANIFISCVDKVKARFEIAEILRKLGQDRFYYSDRPMYWMDFGNSQKTGQVILSTVGNIKQPKSKKYIPVSSLPFVTEEFRNELQQAGEDSKDLPSCSAAEALEKQDLYINAALIPFGCNILNNLLKNAFIRIKGAFVNLEDCRVVPLKVA